MSKIITTRTPLRISFAGGGTDLQSAVRAMGEPGMVLNMSINRLLDVNAPRSSSTTSIIFELVTSGVFLKNCSNKYFITID